MVVASFAVTGADPVLTLFSWLTNLATLCVIALMSMASFAVIVYFRGDRTESPGILVLPIVAGLALLTILVLAIVNFSVLTGASEGLAWALTVCCRWPAYSASCWRRGFGVPTRRSMPAWVPTACRRCNSGHRARAPAGLAHALPTRCAEGE